MTTHTGECLCGAVRFSVEPPYRWFAHCHCSMCRKHHGSLFGSGLGVERARFRWLAGDDDVVHYRATAAFERPFCRRCGAKAPGVSHISDVLLVPAGNVAGDFGMKPKLHIFVGSKSPSCRITDSLPQFDAYPPGVPSPVVERPTVHAKPGVVAGSCLCGSVAYEVDGGVKALINCYCSRCRRSRGAAYATNALARPERLRFTRGEQLLQSYALPGSQRFGTRFCAHCGSLMPRVIPGLGAVLPAGTFDTPVEAEPIAHIFTASKAPWHDITDALPQFAEYPPPEILSALL